MADCSGDDLIHSIAGVAGVPDLKVGAWRALEATAVASFFDQGVTPAKGEEYIFQEE